MGTGYVRNDTPNNIADGNVINASDLDGEFDAVQAAFGASSGHSHDGTAGEGPPIDTAGIAAGAITTVKIEDDAVTAAKLDETGTYTVAGLNTTGNVSFGDNDKAIFGAGSDLQIYHDGADSWISDAAGLGNLYIRSNDLIIMNAPNNETLLRASQDGAVTAYHDGSPKLATTATGIDVTGTVTADDITLDDASPTITLTDSDGPYTGVVRQNGSNTEIKNEASGNIRFYTGSNEEALRISGDKDVQILDGSGTAYGFFDASTQRLGLGTTAPSAILDIESTAPDVHINDSNGVLGGSINSRIIMQASGSTHGVMGFGTSGGTMGLTNNQGSLYLQADTNNAHTSSLIVFTVDNSEKMRILSNGTTGIGTSTPNTNSKFHVSGGRSYFASNSNAFATYLRYDDSTAGVFVGSPAANAFQVSTSSGALRLKVDAEGRLTSSGTGSGDIGIFKTSANSGTGLYINSQTANQIDLVGYDGSAANAVNIRAGGATGAGLNVNTSNNVGIGTASPSTILDVEGANINFASSENGILNVFSDDATAVNKGGSISLGGNSESGSLGFAMIKGARESTDAGYLAFGTRTASANSTERMRISSSGNVGIGTSAPSSPLHVVTTSQRVGTFISTGSDPQVYIGDATTSDNAFILGYDRADNRGYLTVAGDSDNVFTIANGGFVGIGTASPTLDGSLAGLSVNASGTVLQVNDTDGATLRLTDPSTGANRGLGITLQNTEAAISNCESGSLRFGTGNTERMRFTSYGDVGIGRSDPQNIVGNHGGGLVVRSAAGRAATTTLFAVQSSGSYNMLEHLHNGQFKLRNSSNTQTLLVDTSGNLTATGNVTAYSDERLKSDITTIDSALDKVTAMRGVTFTKDGEAGSGVIAQELEKIAPELVMEGEEYKSVAYGNLVGYLIEAVKELSAKVEALENGSTD